MINAFTPPRDIPHGTDQPGTGDELLDAVLAYGGHTEVAARAAALGQTSAAAEASIAAAEALNRIYRMRRAGQ